MTSSRGVIQGYNGLAAVDDRRFANIQNKGMRRFTLRGQKKVSAQWKLFTMVHNIEKVAGVASR